MFASLLPFKRSKSLTIATSIVFVGVAAILDVLTTRPGFLVLFYLPSVFLTAWYVGIQPAIWFSMICALMPLFTTTISANRQLTTVDGIWASASQFVLLVIFSAVLSSLRRARQRERKLERIDFLTGLPNSKAFLERAEAEMRQNTGQPITIAFVDCDNFKYVNDTRGHLVGDELLKTIAATMQAASRNGYTVARLGGDEFAVLLPDTTENSAVAVIGDLRDLLLASMQSCKWPVTFSIGVVTYSASPESVTELIRAADEMMYSVKRAGKNAIEHRSVRVD